MLYTKMVATMLRMGGFIFTPKGSSASVAR
jgi:hypothetical protein